MYNNKHSYVRSQIALWCLAAALLLPPPQPSHAMSSPPAVCPDPEQLPLPSSLPLDKYEEKLGAYLDKRCYLRDNWHRDKYARNTGPQLTYQSKTSGAADDSNFSTVKAGTHSAVWVYYSGDVYNWMLDREKATTLAELRALDRLIEKSHASGSDGKDKNGTKLRPIADHAMIVKEMWAVPAQQYAPEPPPLYVKNEHGAQVVNPNFSGWAIMVKDKQGSWDGWFWGYYYPGQKPDWPAGVNMANMGFGQYCMNCHASAEAESTYSSLRNVLGGPGEPISFTTQVLPLEAVPSEAVSGDPHARVRQMSAKKNAKKSNDCEKLSGDIIDCQSYADNRINPPLRKYAPGFVATFNAMKQAPKQNDIATLPPAGYDHAFAGPDGPQQFLTADQCVGCHDAGGTGVDLSAMTVWLEDKDKYANLSPYGEWRQSPMGLAGRDPIFFSQLESEEKFHAGIKDFIQDTCLHCHGAMGQRQFHIDHPEKTCTPDNQSGCYLREVLNATPFPSGNPQEKSAPYAALSRDGISCMVCHHIELPEQKDFAKTFTGNYAVGPVDELNGPFKDPKEKPMEHSFGIKPVQNDDIKKSEICGSCHTIKLPVYNKGVPVNTEHGNQKYAYEQATYLEWLFSDFREGIYSKIPNGSEARSCQNCHMANAYARPGDDLVDDLKFKIATIEEATDYPEADFRLPPEDIDLQAREGFVRHTLLGANIFLLEMFRQFPTALGIPTQDPMLGTKGQQSLITATESMISQINSHVAKIDIKTSLAGGKLNTDVRVTNVTGHKFPSGVGFRRAFLGFEVLDAKDNVLWASGRTNKLGVIVDERDKPIAGEFWQKADCSAPLYEPPSYPHQPHHELITRQDQAQIFQELTIAPDGYLTTSFLSINKHLKDNRLLPRGFKSVLKGKQLKLDRQAIELAEVIGIQVHDTDEREFLEDIAPYAVGEQNGHPDPSYMDGSGSDSLRYSVALKELKGKTAAKVRVTLYSQSTPPFFLQDRFCTRPDGKDTERLYFLSGHLDLKDTRAQDWKFEVTSASAPVR